MFALLRTGAVDLLLAESLDRLSRGEIDELHIGLITRVVVQPGEEFMGLVVDGALTGTTASR